LSHQRGRHKKDKNNCQAQLHIRFSSVASLGTDRTCEQINALLLRLANYRPPRREIQCHLNEEI
jgi:hypothetical protein